MKLKAIYEASSSNQVRELNITLREAADAIQQSIQKINKVRGIMNDSVVDGYGLTKMRGNKTYKILLQAEKDLRAVKDNIYKCDWE